MSFGLICLRQVFSKLKPKQHFITPIDHKLTTPGGRTITPAKDYLYKCQFIMVARDREDLRAMAVHAGATDLQQGLEWRPEMENVYKALIPNYSENKEQELRKRSVMYWAEELPGDLPILIHHGKLDKRVNVKHAERITQKLQSLSRPVKLCVFENEGHTFRKMEREARNEVVEWFKLHKQN